MNILALDSTRIREGRVPVNGLGMIHPRDRRDSRSAKAVFHR